jgi:hypothetical protein
MIYKKNKNLKKKTLDETKYTIMKNYVYPTENFMVNLDHT